MTEGINGQGLEARNDGVYFDEILGAAGTKYPVGLATNPVNNLADALSIMTLRNLNKLYLAGTGAHAITLTDGINIQIVGNAEYAVTINAGATVTIGSDLLCKSFTNTTGTPTINGNLTSMTTISTTTGTITVWGNAYAGTIYNHVWSGGNTYSLRRCKTDGYGDHLQCYSSHHYQRKRLLWGELHRNKWRTYSWGQRLLRGYS